MIDKKINLIYIASNGRSGSTLLDMLLGKHKNCYTLGEFQMLPIDLKYNWQPCGCGTSIKDCEFWSSIEREFPEILNNGSIGKFKENPKLLRWNELLEIYFNFKTINQKNIKRYGEENFIVLNKVLEKIDENNNIKYLVDASKDRYRLKWLLESGLFNIKVIHIIKRPEAFVYSIIKHENNKLKKIYLTFRMSLRWVVENHIIQKVVDKFYNNQDVNYYKIQYEQLALNPEIELNKIFNYLNLTNSKNILNDGFKHKNHAISGNQMRFNTSEIKLDEKWKQDMPNHLKNIITIISKPFSNLYKS